MKLAIYGSPIGHSLSPAMHNAALRVAGIAGEYRLCDVDASGFELGVQDVRSGFVDGANVTMPHKHRAFELCDEVSATAERAGAVNTLSGGIGKVVGDNTDVAGIRSAWLERGLPTDGPVIILGSGGAAAATQVALDGREIVVVARRPEVAEAAVKKLRSGAQVVGWGNAIPPGTIVNATSIGMAGEKLPKYLLESATGLLDMSYGDKPTPSVETLRKRGVPVADGLDMLVGQAVGSFAIWTGVDVDPAVFRTAAEQELAKRR